LLLDPYGKYRLNAYCGDSLQQKYPCKFDLVIGNPPYNIPKEDKLTGGYGGRSLWDKFVIKAIDDWIYTDKYLCFVHPPSWRKPEHKLWNIMSKVQIHYIKMYSKKEGNKLFGCSTLADYYILQKSKIYKNTTIYGQDNKRYEINLSDWKFLPSGEIDLIKKILGINEVIYSRTMFGTDKKWINKIPSDEYIYPVIHNMTMKGLGYVYSKENKGHIGTKKVILSFNEKQYPFNDWEGKYGMSQICYGLEIKDKEEGDNIIKAINSDNFKNIIRYTKWSTFQTDWRMFKCFRKDFWKAFISDYVEQEQPEPEQVLPEQDLEKKTISQLKQICKDKGIKGYSGKKKADIIKLIKSSE
jgi:hypothetical protein